MSDEANEIVVLDDEEIGRLQRAARRAEAVPLYGPLTPPTPALENRYDVVNALNYAADDVEEGDLAWVPEGYDPTTGECRAQLPPFAGLTCLVAAGFVSAGQPGAWYKDGRHIVTIADTSALIPGVSRLSSGYQSRAAVPDPLGFLLLISIIDATHGLCDIVEDMAAPKIVDATDIDPALSGPVQHIICDESISLAADIPGVPLVGGGAT